MELKLYSQNGTEKAVLSPNTSSVQRKEVPDINELSLSFTLYEFVDIDVNDYIDFMGERYWSTERYLPMEKSTVEWEYNVKLYGIESLIKRFLVLKDIDGEKEAVFSLTARPIDHMRLIVQSINAGMGGDSDFEIGDVEGTGNVVIDYKGKYCDAALNELADAVGTEWWIEGRLVHLCRCEYGEELTIGYGNGLTNLDRDMADNAKFYTRLFPIGSSRNIDPEVYGHSRLQLPNGAKYVDVNTERYGIIHHYEQEAFADIYPRHIGTVSHVRHEEVTGSDGNPFTIYYFQDDGLNFDPNDYEIGGLVKRVSFQEGSELAGLGTSDDHYFEVNYNSTTHEFEIITIWPYDDDTQLPGGTLVPEVGDNYILWNIRMPQEYNRRAELEFEQAVNEYNAKHVLDVSIYKGPTDHVWVEEKEAEQQYLSERPLLYVGRRVRLESGQYFPETGYRCSRITKITRKVTLPSQVDIEIGDALSKGFHETITESVDKRITEQATYLMAKPFWEEYTNSNGARSLRLKDMYAGVLINGFLSVLGSITSLNGIRFGKGGNYGIDGNGDGVLRELTVDKLTATVAHFFELIIDKIKSVGGQIIVTAANAEITQVEEVLDENDHVVGYKCYWPSTDGDKAVHNEFCPGDQVVCSSFNEAQVGQHTANVSNHFYWRLCTAIGTEDGRHYIILSNKTGEKHADSNATPQMGDNIALLGYNEAWRQANESSAALDYQYRQCAIILSAYNHAFLDYDIQHPLKAPYIAQYKNITTFSLGYNNRATVLSPNGNVITGDLRISSGESVENVIQRTAFKESATKPAQPNEIPPVSLTNGWSYNLPTNATEQIWACVYKDGWGDVVRWNAHGVNPNMLLRTVFEQGLDRVKEKWSANWNAVTIDTSHDTQYIQGRQSIRISTSAIENNTSFTQSVLGKLKANTTYTFSFYCFASRSFVFYINNVIDGDRTNIYENNKVIRDGQEYDVTDNGHNDVIFSNGWSQTYHTITFKTNSDVSTERLEVGFYVSYDSYLDAQVLVLCMPKLEEGDCATAYMANDDDLQGRDGENGTSPFVVDINNEMDSVACDATGKATSNAMLYTKVSAFYGSSEKTDECTIRLVSNGTTNGAVRLVTSDSDTGAGTVISSAQSMNGKHYVRVAFSSGSTIPQRGEVVLEISHSTYGTSHVSFIINGVRPGADGENAIIYNLLPSVSEVNVGRTDAGGYSPRYNTLKCGYRKNDGGNYTTVDDAASTIDNKYRIFFRRRVRATGIYESKYYFYGYATHKRKLVVTTGYSTSGLDAESYDKVEFTLYPNTSSTELNSIDSTLIFDQETVPVVADGTNGTNGQDAHEINPNILLRTVFNNGWDFVAEKWNAEYPHTRIDTAPDTVIEGHKSVRINATNVQNFTDFKQDVIGSLKTSTWYTLSFYYFATDGWRSFLYPGFENAVCIDKSAGIIVDGVTIGESDIPDNGGVDWRADWTGSRHTVTFKTASSFPAASGSTPHFWIIFRAVHTNSENHGQVAICMPKLETGVNATAYIANDDDLRGENAIEYDLEPLEEKAVVDRNNLLTVSLQYYLRKQDGETASYESYGNDYKVYYQASNEANPHEFSNYTGGIAQKTFTVQNYVFGTGPTHYTIILKYGNTEIRRRIVMVQMEAKSVFEVTDEAIRSSVKAIEGAKNYFGFNRGAYNDKNGNNEECQLYPYGYGIACWGTNNRIRNLGTTADDNRSTWTLAFEARSNTGTPSVTPNICGQAPTSGSITLSTSWKKYVCLWDTAIDYAAGFSAGGYLDFYTSSGLQFYVRNITLIKGVFSNLGFVKAQEDMNYGGSMQPFTWLLRTDNAEKVANQVFMGMDVYKNKQTIQQSGASYLDLVQYDDFEIKNKTPYTLSFWARSNVDGVWIDSFFYNGSWNLINGISGLDNMTSADGRWTTALTTDWKRYTVHWFPNVDAIDGSDSSKKLIKKIIGCRITNQTRNLNAFVYFAGMTFQEGWVENGTTTVMQSVSSINQTAKSISLQVENIGQEMSELSIEAGEISSKIYVGSNNLVMNGAFKRDAEFWEEWGTPTTREIVEISGKKWMHIVTSGSKYQGYSQNRYASDGIEVQGGQQYTISMLARGASANTQICVGFHWHKKSESPSTISSQNWYYFTIGTDATKCEQTITIPAAADFFNIMVGDNSEQTKQFWITDIKFEKGSLATEWTPAAEEEKFYVRSSITQTANEIRAEVGSCGVDITQNKITLDGNTEVNGMLTLNGDTQGFKVTGNGGNAYITPKTIGAESAWSNRAAIDITCTRKVSKFIVEDTLYYQGVFTSVNNFGYAKSGSQLILKNHSLSFQQKGYSPITPVTSGTTKTYTKYYIYIGSSTTPTEVTVNGTTASSITTFTISSGGNVKVVQEVHGVFRKEDIHTSSSQSSLTTIPEMVCTQSYIATMPTGTVESVIGYDGLGVNFGNGKYVYIGQESAVFKFGGNGLKVTSSGVQRLVDGNWLDINKMYVKRISSSYTVTDTDGVGMIVGTSNNSALTITLPSPGNNTGRKIYIKPFGSAGMKVAASTACIVNWSARSYAVSQIADLSEGLQVFMSDGQYWYRGYFGD